MDQKGRFLKALNKRLSTSQKQLLSLIQVENRKEALIFRMPVGVISLDSVWEQIAEVGKELTIKCSKANVFATLDELDDILGDIQWLWDKWIPKGFVTMVAGDPGIGKSAIVQHFVKIITGGGKFPLQGTACKKGNVIWIDTEASQQLLKVRAGTMEIDKKRVFLPVIDGDILNQANLTIENNREQIINLIEGVQPELLVLDSLGGSHTGGENRVEDIRPILEFLALTARDYQMAVIAVHHLNKGRADESPEISLYRIRGSTVITAYCRSILAIEPSYDKKTKMRMIKSNLARVTEPISILPQMDNAGDILGFDYAPYIPPPAKKNKKDICADWVFKVLSESKEGVPLTELIEIGSGVGFTRQTIYSSREILGDRITFSGSGNKAFWHITREDRSTMKKIISGVNGKRSTTHAKNKSK